LKEKYKLDKAIKELYKIEPLQQDLAATVANKIFAEHKKESAVLDRILLSALCLVIAISLIYGFSLLAEISPAALLLFVIMIAGFIGLSAKEYSVLSQRIQSQR
jgi:hypothetical protein